MHHSPNQQKKITLDKLNLLRTQLYNAYFVCKREELQTPNNKASIYYHELQKEIKKIAKVTLSEGTLNGFFNDDSKLNFRLLTLQSIEKFIAKYLQSADPEKNDDNLHLSDKIENKLLNYYQQKVDFEIHNSVDFDLSLDSFQLSDIELLKKIQPLKDSLGDIHWDLIENRFKANSNILKGLKIINSIDEKIIVGFFILYPITEVCRQLIEKTIITKSDQIELEHICSDFKTASAIYISLVFAMDRYSKAFLLLKLKDEIFSTISDFPRIKTLYVRPASEDGLRNIEKNKFQKMLNPSPLYFQETDLIFNNV